MMLSAFDKWLATDPAQEQPEPEPVNGWRVVWLPEEGAEPDEHRDFTDEDKARIFANHWRLVAAKMVLSGDADPGVRIQVEEISL